MFYCEIHFIISKNEDNELEIRKYLELLSLEWDVEDFDYSENDYVEIADPVYLPIVSDSKYELDNSETNFDENVIMTFLWNCYSGKQ